MIRTTVCALCMFTATFAADHPFLLMRTDGLAALRDRAQEEPWKTAVDDAQRLLDTVSYDTGLSSAEDKSDRFNTVLSAGLLAYIALPDIQETIRPRLLSLLDKLGDIQSSRKEYWDWGDHVPVACAAFNATLALDILYNDITPSDRQAVENDIETIIGDMNTDAWEASVYSTRATYALYKGDESDYTKWSDEYRKLILQEELSEDGIFTGGPGYGASRFGKVEREQKYMFMHIEEFTGRGGWYDLRQLENFYEWLLGNTRVPGWGCFVFGDTKIYTWTRPQDWRKSSGLYGAHHFSSVAGGYAAWLVSDTIPVPRVTSFLVSGGMPDPIRPQTSRVYADGGAWFVHNPEQGPGFGAALWNTKRHSDHAHKETNAIHLRAYDTHLLMNSGYSGWGKGGDGFSWDWVHATAEASNTILINGNDHTGTTGNGITESLVTDWLHYATGHSGIALDGGVHRRSLVLCLPTPSTEGYFLIFDEIQASNNAADVALVLHPYSATVTTISEGERYMWDMKPHQEKEVGLTLYLGDSPESVHLKDGLLAAKGLSIVGKYLYATYPTDAGGEARLVTLAYPYRGTSPAPSFSRISTNHVRGIEILGTSVTDIACVSGSTGPVAVGSFVFSGSAAWMRQRNDTTIAWFVRKGRALADGAGHGFTSSAAVSITVNETKGLITGPSCRLSLRFDGASTVLVDGKLATPVDAAENRIDIDLPAGTHELELLAHGQAATPTAMPTRAPRSRRAILRARLDRSSGVVVHPPGTRGSSRPLTTPAKRRLRPLR